MRVLVNVNKVTLDEKDKLNAGEYNIHEVEFVFSEEYNNLIKKATFSTKEHAYLVEITNSSVIIPYEVLEETGDFEIGAFGYDTNGDELVLRYSPSPTYVHVDLGSYRDNFDNYKVPTADVIEQLTERIENAEATVEGYDDRLTTAENKLEGIEDGAEVNIIEDVKVNGTSLEVVDKSVNIPIPTKTSDIQNDSGYITKEVDNLTNYTKTGDMNTAINNAVNGEKELRQQADTNLQTQIDAITSATDVVDVVGTYQELQAYDTSKLTDKDVIKVLQDSTHNNALSYYRWIKSSSSWSYLGSEGPFYTKGETDTLLNTKQNTIDSSHKLNADYIDDTLTTNKFVTSSDKSNWNSKYDKPSGGIPKTDLSSDVQTSLGKADTALQEHQDISGKEDKSNKVTSISSSSTNTQYPSAKLLYDKLEEISNDLYNNATVEQEGETLTLNNTGNSTLKLDLKGNTSQYTTSGNQLVDLENPSGTSNCTYDSSSKVYTTSALSNNYSGFNAYTSPTKLTIPTGESTFYFSLDIRLKSGTYTGKLNYFRNGVSITDTTQTVEAVSNPNMTSSFQRYEFKVVYTNSSGSNQTCSNFFAQFITGLDNAIFEAKNLMISKSSNAEYEPYTNGVTPRPDYPQPVNVVSGDNEVVVRGKQLFDGELELGILDGDTGQPVANTSYMRTKNFILVEELTEYVINSIDISAGIAVYEYKEDYTYNLTSNKVLSNGQAFTTERGTKYIKFRPRTANTDLTSRFMLNKGSTPSPYQPYQSQTYPINLPVENLFDKDNVVKVENKILNDSGVEINDNGGAYTKMYIPVQPNTNYTISGLPQYATKRIYFFDSSKQWLSRTSGYTSVSEFTFTTPNNCKYIDIQYVLQDNDFNTYQIELGSKANHYTEYGTTPIELCKIGDYQDYFTKNSGKNLEQGMEQGGINERGTLYHSDTTIRSKNYDEVKPNTQYTISLNNEAVVFSVLEYDENKNLLSFNVITGAFTTGATTKYIKVTKKTSLTNRVMVNEGEQVLPYEPYGTGQWCKYNAIGKVVLDGTDTGIQTIGGFSEVSSYTGQGTSYQATFSQILTKKSYSEYLVLSNYFKKAILNERNDYTNIIYTYSDGILRIATSETTKNNFLTWLSTHNTNVYYVLSTPYLSLIEDTSLIEQLDNLEYAMSYEGTTNIGQVNNDKPFIISATAFKPTIAGEIASLKYENSRLKERVKKLEEEDTL